MAERALIRMMVASFANVCLAGLVLRAKKVMFVVVIFECRQACSEIQIIKGNFARLRSSTEKVTQ